MYSGNNCGCGAGIVGSGSSARGTAPRRAVYIETQGSLRIPLAKAYVPFQQFGETYNTCESLKRGTIFPCLYRPYK